MTTVTILNYNSSFDASIYFTGDAPTQITENGTFSYGDSVEYIYWSHMSGKSGEYHPSDPYNITIDFNTLLGGSSTSPATVTVTVSGSPHGNTDIIVYDSDGTSHFPRENGIYTYEGLGVVSIYAYDFDLMENATTIDISDPFNVIIIFGDESTYTININIDFTTFTFDDNTVISYYMNGVTNDYPCSDDIFDLSTDYSKSFGNVGLSSDYELIVIGYPDGITPIINKTVSGTIITYNITWSNGDIPDEPDTPPEDTKASLIRIYIGNEWKNARMVIYKKGTWVNATPKIIKTTT